MHLRTCLQIWEHVRRSFPLLTRSRYNLVSHLTLALDDPSHHIAGPGVRSELTHGQQISQEPAIDELEVSLNRYPNGREYAR